MLATLCGVASAAYRVSVFAGPDGTIGSADGAVGSARFNQPRDVAVDGSGTLYVADMRNCTIRKITTAGVVSTLAGSPGEAGSTDGLGAAARFNNPFGLAVDGNGTVYVADTYNCTIRKVTPDGVVSTLAGSPGVWGFSDGTLLPDGSTAEFKGPMKVAVDGSANVYVTDVVNHAIRKITPTGVVSTLAGDPGVPGSADGTGSAARFSLPQGLAVDGNDNVYVGDVSNRTIRKITPAGVVTTLAGSPGVQGSDDGTGSAARFDAPIGLAVDGSDNIYVADSGTIRKVTSAGVVTTLAGTTNYWPINEDGTGSNAHFYAPWGVAVAVGGTLYVADSDANTIRKVTSAGVVTTVAGCPVNYGNTDGARRTARFTQPVGVALDGNGNMYIADRVNRSIRKITAAGVVSTFVVSPGNYGSPNSVAVDGSGNVYVADSRYVIRKITPAGMVSDLAGSPGNSGSADGSGSTARFGYLESVAVDGSGNVYVADGGNATIRKITPAGMVSTLAGSPGNSGSADGSGSAARFNDPCGVAVDGAGDVYVADTENRTIRKITPAGVVTTLAGNPDAFTESVDGTGSTARFNFPEGIAVDGSGNVYVGDRGSGVLRKVTPAGVVTTLADTSGIPLPFGNPTGLAVDESGNLYVADAINNNIAVVTPMPPIAPGELLAPQIAISGGNLTFTVRPSVAGRRYQLQQSDTMESGSWIDVGPVFLGDGADLVITIPRDPTAPQRFYRLALDPTVDPPGFALIPAGMRVKLSQILPCFREIPALFPFVVATISGQRLFKGGGLLVATCQRV
ncbi:MAG: hypothetical protein NTW21_32770, partial [Verrucomicrobia bacterium]|nr:hypothetical protein [Verrucomicrobiota bacterium]